MEDLNRYIAYVDGLRAVIGSPVILWKDPGNDYFVEDSTHFRLWNVYIDKENKVKYHANDPFRLWKEYFGKRRR